MPKARQTCTECSIRRQKCDRGRPCARCVKRGVAERCTTQWSHRTSTLLNPICQSIVHPTTERAGHLAEESCPIPPSILAANSQSTNQSRVVGCLEVPAGRQSNPHEDIPGPFLDILGRAAEVRLDLPTIQLLLPDIACTRRLVLFHEKRLLWYHGCFHGPTFNEELKRRVRDQGLTNTQSLRLTRSDLHWFALLFAIFAASVTCASSESRYQLGFGDEEADKLSHKWHAATTACLELGRYRSIHSKYTVQAIATLGMCAHTLGYSAEQFILTGEAIRLSQYLGLHLIGEELKNIECASSAEDRSDVLGRETIRRLFCQLCVQDWFSIPFTGTRGVQAGEFVTGKPTDRDYLTMEPLPHGEPNYISYNNYLYEIASLIAKLHTDLVRSHTDFTRYEKVMQVDAQMRELATQRRPLHFDVTVRIEPDWPWFIPWARRSLTICFAHKMIVIHRSFLARSFGNSVFSHSRKTCIAAAKTIINEASQERDSEEPIIWIDEAFCISAGVILAVDVLHRQSSDLEREMHLNLLQKCIQTLGKCRCSPLSVRGVVLLSTLLECCEAQSASGASREKILCDMVPSGILEMVYSAGRKASIDTVNGAVNTGCSGLSGWPELLPAQTGFNNAFIFGHLLGLDLR